MRQLIFVMVLFVLSAQANASFRVMTLNTEWLWTPHDGHVDGSKFNKGDMSPKAYQEELTFYSKLIQRADVDLVALAEIENQRVASDLARQVGPDWRVYYKQGRDTATGQDLAIISRLDVVKRSVSHYGFPCGKAKKAKKRKCLSKVLGLSFYHPSKDGSQIALVTSHFLSKRNDSRKKTLKRHSQAHALVKAAKRAAKDSEALIVLGDLNDYLGSDTIQTLIKGLSLDTAKSCEQQGFKPGMSTYKYRHTIDHILYRGLRCKGVWRAKTEKYSDHDAVIMVLE